MRTILLLLCLLLGPAQALAWANPLPGIYGGTPGTPPPPTGLNVFIYPVGATVTYGSSGTYSTSAVTALPQGGVGPYTYVWTRISGNGPGAADAPTSATTTWTATVASTNTFFAQWQVRVTDSASNVAIAQTPVSFSPNTDFPLSSLRHGLVLDNFLQTQVNNPSSGKPSYVSKPKVILQPIQTTKAVWSQSLCTVTLTLAVSPNKLLAPNQQVLIAGALGTGGYLAANGTFTTASGTGGAAGTTVVYSVPSCPTMALSSATLVPPDTQNLINAGITYVRIPVDAEAVLPANPSDPGIPFATTYLQAVKSSAASYDMTSGMVTVTTPFSLNILPPFQTTASAAYSGVSTIGVNSASGIIGGANITDLTTPAAIPAGTSVATISGNAITLLAAVGGPANVTGMHSGDVLSINYTLSTSAVDGSGGKIAPLGVTTTAAAGTGGTKVVYQVSAGLTIPTISSITLTNIYQPLASALTSTMSNTAGCAQTYVSTYCTSQYNFAYLDQIMLSMVTAGISSGPVIFIVNPTPNGVGNRVQTFQMLSGYGTGSPTGNLHEDMSSSPSYQCYGFVPTGTSGLTTCYEGALQAANLATLNRYALMFPAATQFFQEFYNEPDYRCSGGYISTCSPPFAYQNVAAYNQGNIDIDNALRTLSLGGAGDSVHWFIIDGIASAKAENLPATIPVADTQVVYSFHKYDPIVFVNQTAGSSNNALLLYPAPSSVIHGTLTPSEAVGRPNNVTPPFIPPQPVLCTSSTVNCPSIYNNSVTLKTSAGCPSVTWLAGTVLSAASQQQACITGGGGNTTKLDFFTPLTPSSNPQFTIWDFYNNATNGISHATSWAAAGGHVGPRTGEPVLIMAGEIGIIPVGCDYRSCRQFLYDLRTTLDSSAVSGGQLYIPSDLWALDGLRFGVRPKGQGAGLVATNGTLFNNFCLYGYGQLSAYNGPLYGYDADLWARWQTTAANPPMNCSGAQYGTPGLP